MAVNLGAAAPHQHHDGPMDMGMQLEKADPRVAYSAQSSGDDSCGTCRFFDSMCQSCDVVEGSIDATWGCKLWTKPFAGSDPATPDQPGDPMEMYREPLFQVFMEASQAFAAGTDLTKPQWIPFLPKPGVFEHPKYGTITVTAGMNKELVDSVKNRVYQENIPLDAEHETKLSGAVAWIKDMRMNEDGSADAYVEWAKRGQQLLSDGAYKYISPEWFADWRDPGTGVVHRNVIAGGAITTRPFFKDKVLRALVASETGAQVISQGGIGTMPDPKDKAPEADPKKAAEDQPKTFTEAEVAAQVDAAVAAAALKAKETTDAENRTFAERLTAAETTAAEAKTAREAAEARVGKLEAADRHQRFTALVAGRGGSSDGAAWAGDPTKQISMLETFAEKFGEESPVFVSYVEQQTAIAAQIRESGLFTEFGSAASAPSTTAGSEADNQLDALAKARMSKDPAKTYHQHYAEVLNSPEGKALYQRSPSATPKRNEQ